MTNGLLSLLPPAYTPTDVLSVLVIAVVLLGVLALGFVIARIESPVAARLAAWLLVALSTMALQCLTAAQPAGVRMNAIILATLFGMKAVVAVESRLRRGVRLRFVSWAAFAGGWFGMRPAAFVNVPRRRDVDVMPLVLRGVWRFAAGLTLAVVARGVVSLPDAMLGETARRWAATVILMLGLSLMLHFGVFNWMVALWQRLGANVRPLFRAPLVSRSLSEFWGERWNLAFVEMTSLGVYRPLRGVAGERVAMAAVFIFSGLLHELAISLPVMAGFGLPTLYFALHAVAMTLERHWQSQGRPISDHGVWSRVWTLAWILMPLPVLFHPPFIRGCIWPMLGIEG